MDLLASETGRWRWYEFQVLTGFPWQLPQSYGGEKRYCNGQYDFWLVPVEIFRLEPNRRIEAFGGGCEHVSDGYGEPRRWIPE